MLCHLFRTPPGLDDCDGVGEDEGHEPGHGGRHEVVARAELGAAVAALHAGLDGLVEEEVGSPGAAGRHHVGRDAAVEAAPAFRPHDRGDGVTDAGVLGPPRRAVIHSEPAHTPPSLSTAI